MHLCCFFFNDTATTELYTLSLHDALPIFRKANRLRQDHTVDERRVTRCPPHLRRGRLPPRLRRATPQLRTRPGRPDLGAGVVSTFVKGAGLDETVEARYRRDRKSTRLNSSHANISYAVF